MTTVAPGADALAPPVRGPARESAGIMVRYGLRSHRWSLAGVAFLGFVSPYSAAASYVAATGTAALRASFGRQTVALGPQLAYLVPLPIRPDTVAGYMWWKGLTWLTLVFAVWGLAAATGLVRNEEERGLVETWITQPLSRVRLLLSRVAAFTAAALVAVIITGLGTAAGLVAAKASVRFPALAGQGAALLGVTLACFGIGLAAAQLISTRRAALTLGGAVMLVLYILDALARVNPGLDGAAAISPFHLADITTAVVPGGHFEGGATIALFVIAAVLVVLSALAFQRRDLGAALFRRRPADTPVVRTPSANPLLRLPVLSSLWEQRIGMAGWVVGSILGAGFVVSIADSTGKLLASVSGFQRFIHAAGTNSAATAVVSSVWLSVAALIVAAFAITQTSRWAGEDAGGRLEMELAQPVSRWRVVAERGLTLTVTAVLMTALGSLVTAAIAPSQGVDLDSGGLLTASALLVLLALTFGALGALVIARFPRVAVPVLGVVAVESLYLPLLAPLFKWPGWVLDLSLFHLYGTPLTTGVYWTGLWVMVAIVVVGFGGAMAAMRVREVGS
jgi:ABC-2 type transport system permease protein